MDYVSRLKARKSELGMTNEQLSAASGVPMGTLSKLLAGMNDSPKLGNLAALCRTLDLSLDYVVWGKPENKNNYSLSGEEIALIERYRTLDQRGQDTVVWTAQKQAEFAALQTDTSAAADKPEHRAVRLQTPSVSRRRTAPARFLPLYDLPVSAGTGAYLDDTNARQINVPAAAPDADFLLRISGNSMEPKYHDRDLLLVERTEQVREGEIGIFVLDGEGYVKQWGGDALISLNPAYAPIPITSASNLQCCGRVVGRMKAKRN
ncbi:MAG: helix-turn-helix domain-containing protein [Clostridia bacterium]|nr:helix-turn-helix domain-containing protein [Clostridia bacterium]